MARPTSKSLGQLSGKHQLIDKANSYLVIASALATVVVIFSIFASIELINKISYQNKVISYREDARDQLENNLESVDLLKASYSAFEDTPESIIGTSDKNSKIVLDALPSKYDFPAFATSLEFILQGAGLTIDDITGTDLEIEASNSSINPEPIEIPFTISGSGNYESVQKLIKDLERSIRPFKIVKLGITGEGNDLTVTIDGISYYQPAKEIGINKQVVKSDKPFVLEQTVDTTNLEGATQ